MQMRAHKSRAARAAPPFKCACLCSLPALPPAARMSELPLKLEPAERLVFAGKKLGAEPANATLKVTNPTADRMAFKIKCTSNEMFRIRPVIGVVKAKEETTVTAMVAYFVLFPDSTLIHALNLDRTPFPLVYVNVAGEVCWLNGLIAIYVLIGSCSVFSTGLLVWLLPAVRRMDEGATYAENSGGNLGLRPDCCLLPCRPNMRPSHSAMKLLLVVLPSIKMVLRLALLRCAASAG
ncbi:Major sperm protein [Aphelenchoides fujianensis]|nr:Major sperm protein [Aphelenchoides fujianensis]